MKLKAICRKQKKTIKKCLGKLFLFKKRLSTSMEEGSSLRISYMDRLVNEFGRDRILWQDNRVCPTVTWFDWFIYWLFAWCLIDCWFPSSDTREATVKRGSTNAIARPVVTGLLVSTTSSITPATALTVTRVNTARSMLIGARLILASMGRLVSKCWITTSVFVPRAGQASCAMWKWSAVRTLLFGKVSPEALD